jgi:hypothetical protein
LLDNRAKPAKAKSFSLNTTVRVAASCSTTSARGLSNSHAAREVAVHATLRGRRQRAIDPAHYAGIAGTDGRYTVARSANEPPPVASSSLLRPLCEYETFVGGGF